MLLVVLFGFVWFVEFVEFVGFVGVALAPARGSPDRTVGAHPWKLGL